MIIPLKSNVEKNSITSNHVLVIGFFVLRINRLGPKIRQTCLSNFILFIYFFVNSHLMMFFPLIFRDTEREREGHRERNINLLLPICTLTGNRTHDPSVH